MQASDFNGCTNDFHIKTGILSKGLIIIDELREYLKQLEDDGYIDEKGQPLKCMNCEHKEFTMVDDHYCHMGLEEYSLKCNNCGSIVGHWAYGYWQV